MRLMLERWGKKAEDPGVGWWTVASGLDWFVGWRKVPSVMFWWRERAWNGMFCEGMPQNNWAKGILIVVELHSALGGWEEDWWWGRKAGARWLSDISGEVRWLPVVVLPIVERGEMCFESCILDVCYPKRLFPICRTLVWDSIVGVD